MPSQRIDYKHRIFYKKNSVYYFAEKRELWHVHKVTDIGVVEIFQSPSLADVRASLRAKRVRKDRIPKNILQRIELFDKNNEEVKKLKQFYNILQSF